MKMFRDVSDRELAHRDYTFSIWRRDRNDVYRCCGEALSDACLGIRLYFEAYEIKCNPDFDW